MNLKRIAGSISIIIISCLFWCSYFVFTDKNVAKKILLANTQKIEVQEKSNKIYYELHKTMESKSIPVSVYLNGKKIITFTQIAEGLTTRQRALVLVNRLKDFVKNNENPGKIFPGFEKGIAVIKYEDKILFTADVKNAKVAGLTVSELTFACTNNIRKAFGVSELIKDPDLLKIVVNRYNNKVKYNELGVASWYGGYFHGRTAADGSTYDMYRFTAAHKYLPFGSIVKVTNLKNSTSCIVKITDRGPFIDGRIIDLSKVAAKEIDMLDSGISNVKIEVIGKV